MNDSSTFFEAFPPVSMEEWEAQIVKDLKGADYKKKLRWETGEGISPLPFYRQRDLQQLEHVGPVMNSSNRSWEVRESVHGTTIQEASESAHRALRGGSDALQFSFHFNMNEGGNFQFKGVPLHNQTYFSQLMEGIPLQKTSLHLDAGLLSPALLAMLWHEVQRQSLKPDTIRGTLYFDPFAHLLQYGFLAKSSKLSENISRLASFCQQNLPLIRPLAIDGRIFHESGGTIVQELGFSLSSAAELLSQLTEEGFSIDEAAPALHFSFSTGSKYFLEIAKFRALRLLWENLLKAFGGNPEKYPAYVYAETSRWNKTMYDPYTNMLRTSTEGMSAVLGGCDALTVLPFDESFQKPDDFSQRIARNSQIIMREEAYLDKVRDPAAGSYYIEQLTHDLARKAWKLFQEVEKKGGMLSAIKEGFVQASIQSSRQERDLAIAKRQRIFVGTNQYPAPNEQRKNISTKEKQWRELDFSDKLISEPLDVHVLTNSVADGAKIGDIVAALTTDNGAKIPTLEPYRGARAFEKLRLATEQSDTCPTVLNVPIGNPKIRKARSSFSTNFFGCIGYNIEDPIEYKDVTEAVQAIQEQQPDMAVLCSSDPEYKQVVPDLCEKINQMKKRPLVVLAGYPEEHVKNYRRAGIDLFIHAECNVLETLKEVQEKLGVIKN